MIPAPTKIGVVVAAVAATLLATAVYAAPIATSTALPLSAGEVVVREQFAFSRSFDRLAGVAREVALGEARTVAGFGLTPRLALFGVLPLIQTDVRMEGTDVRHAGLGDAAVFARYEVYRADRRGATTRIAPFAGMRLPTGRDGQTGDGSTDFFGGLIATLASTQWVLDSQLRLDLNREADGFERGDSTSLESSFQYRLAPGQVTLATRGFVYGVIELSASHLARDKANGRELADSGGFLLALTPGLQYATQRWIADFGVALPLIKNLNGTALELDYTVLTSIRINF